eukprot:841118-Prorocentrum_minimum.AAC.1
MLNVLYIVKRGVHSLKARADRRKRLPKEQQLTWSDKLILLLTTAVSYSITSKVVPRLEGMILKD